MFLRFLTFLKESPFIEGMGRIFDFAGVIRDFKHSFILPLEKRSDGELNKQ